MWALIASCLGRSKPQTDVRSLKESTYYLDKPKAKIEVSRLDTQHQVWLLLLDDRLYTAPVMSTLSSHLDVGCGTGVWTAAMAEEHPEARVVGLDLTPPSGYNDLGNLEFIEGDALQTWNFAKDCRHPFEFITARVLVTGINNWPQLFQNCYDNLAIGGWVEVHDIQVGTFSEHVDWRDESSPLMKWYQCFRRGFSVQGIDGFASTQRTQELQSVGFKDVSEKFYRCYLDEDAAGDSPKQREIARLTRTSILGLIESVTKVMMAKAQWGLLGIDAQGLLALKELAKQDVLANAKSRKYHWIMSVHAARKGAS